jgi:hypothetical protein
MYRYVHICMWRKALGQLHSSSLCSPAQLQFDGRLSISADKLLAMALATQDVTNSQAARPSNERFAYFRLVCACSTS